MTPENFVDLVRLDDAQAWRIMVRGAPQFGNQGGDTMIGLERSEALVLQLRFGNARRVLPRGEVARRLQLSIATVRRVELGALRRLRRQALVVAERGNDWDEV